MERIAFSEKSGTELIEAGATNAEMGCCGGGIECPGVEITQNSTDESGGLAVEKLLIFKSAQSQEKLLETKKIGGIFRSVLAQPLRRPPLRSGLLLGCAKTLVPHHLAPPRPSEKYPQILRIPVLLRLPVQFCSVSV